MTAGLKIWLTVKPFYRCTLPYRDRNRINRRKENNGLPAVQNPDGCPEMRFGPFTRHIPGR